jgi:hypothetical protein
MLPRQIQSILANPLTLAVAAIFALALVAYMVAALLRRRQEAREVAPNEPPPLLIPGQRRSGAASPLFPMRMAREGPTNPLAGSEPGNIPEPAPVASASSGPISGPVSGPVSGPISGGGLRPAPLRNGVSAAPAGVGHEVHAMAPAASARANGAGTSKVVHTLPPMDGTLQFLPGRLEIVDGDSPGRDIRFVRTWGEVPEITFGRVTGPPYRHVQLRSQTVSRQHARMQYTDGRWQLTNLSQTNPVVINGQALDTAHGQRVLREGDQIEMGEVVFRFRER